MQVAGLFLYPVKSCGGIAVSAAALTPRGFEYDRRWIVVDAADGRALTQRDCPALATVAVQLRATGLLLTMPDGARAEVAIPHEQDSQPLTLFGQTLQGHRAPDGDAFFSQLAGRPCLLLHQGDHAQPVSADWTDGRQVTGFSDGFPLLVVNEASRLDLGRRMGAEVPMDRFRPNIVVSGADAWDEDGWRELQIGDERLQCVKPCTRCVITTIDQQQGVRTGPQPLQALTRFRMSDDPRLRGTLFGQNAVTLSQGMIRIGDPVTCLSRQTPPAFKAARPA